MATNWEKTVKDIKNEADPAKAKEILKKAIEEDKKAKDRDSAFGPKDIQAAANYNKILQQTAQALGDIQGLRKAQSDGIEHEIALLLKKQNGLLKNAEAAKLARDIVTGNSEFAISQYGQEIEKLVEKRKQLDLLEAAEKKYGAQQREVLGEFASMIGINMKFKDSLLGKTVQMTAALRMQGEEGDAVRQKFIDNFKEVFSFQNITLSTFMKIFEMTGKLVKEFDTARAEVAAATGAAYKYEDAMFAAQRSTNLYGVSMKDVSKATIELANNTSNFAKFSQSAQNQLTQTTAMLGKVGVDSSTAAESFQFLNLNLGMTVDEAARAQKQIAMMGTEIGISSAKMTKDFNKAMKTLAVYGPKGVDVFKNLASSAKAAGVEVDTLLNLAGKFDTFKGSAETVGRLNALLGTQLSTTQMLMATEDERIETLISSVQAQGIAFKDMDRFTQKAIAAAAGIDDMNEAQRIFGMNLGDYQKNRREMEKNEKIQEKFNDAVSKTVPIFQKFKLLATEAVTAVQPILETLGTAAEWLTEQLRDMDPETKSMVVGFVAFASAGAMLAIAMGPLISSMVSLAPALYGVGAAGPAAGTGIAAIGTGVATAVAEISLAIAGSLGVGALVVGALLSGMGIIAYTMVEVAKAEAKSANAMARKAEAQMIMVDLSSELADSSSQVLKNLEGIAGANFDNALKGMTGLISKANEFGGLNPKVTATIENLALITAGAAKDSMTGRVIDGANTNVTANVNNVFSGMKMVLEVGGKEIEGVVKGWAADTVLN